MLLKRNLSESWSWFRTFCAKEIQQLCGFHNGPLPVSTWSSRSPSSRNMWVGVTVEVINVKPQKMCFFRAGGGEWIHSLTHSLKQSSISSISTPEVFESLRLRKKIQDSLHALLLPGFSIAIHPINGMIPSKTCNVARHLLQAWKGNGSWQTKMLNK